METTYFDLLQNIEADKKPYDVEPIFKEGDLVECEETGLRLYVAMVDFVNSNILMDEYKKIPMYRLSFYKGDDFKSMARFNISCQMPYHGNEGLKLVIPS